MNSRLKFAGIHLLSSAAVASMSGLLVFLCWYPPPFAAFSGGLALFAMLVSIDVVLGPMLTAVVANPRKGRAELTRDMGVIVLVQLAAFAYGMATLATARPLYLVHEVDRFKVIARPDLQGATLEALPAALQPGWLTRPLIVATRPPRDETQRQRVMMESAQGGRDYAERPEFYIPYAGEAVQRALSKAKALATFLEKQPAQLATAQALGSQHQASIAQWFYVPILARKDWVAVLDARGQIVGYLQGDGF